MVFTKSHLQPISISPMQRVKEFPDEGLTVSGSGFSLRIIGGLSRE